MKAKSSPISLPELVLLALLALVPVVFSRMTQECFEVPQSSVLATGAIVLFSLGLAQELGRVAREGVGSYLAAAGARLSSWAARDPLGIGVLLYLASAAASTVTAPNPRQSVHGASDSTAGLVTAISTAVVYFASRVVSRGNPLVLIRCARAAGLAAAVASGYALIQLTGLDPFIWGRTATYEGDIRIFGTLGHPNMLGAYLAMTAPLTVWLSVRARSGAERVLWALVSTASVVAVAATLSRGAWIGLGAGGLAALLFTRLARGRPAQGPAPRASRRSARVPAAIGAALLLAAAAALFFARTPMGPHLAERVRQLASLSAPTTQSRLQIWRAGWSMLHDHPWLGVGLDSFGILFPRYRTPEYWRIEWGRTPNKAHNEAIQILATQGVVGGVAALVVIVFTGIAIVRALKRCEGSARSGAIAAGASLVAFAAQDLASFTVVALGCLASGIAGWLASAAEGAPERGEAPSRSRKRAPGWTRVLAAVPAVALFFFMVALPIRAQLEEKAALRQPVGSPGRAEGVVRAARFAPWDGRYPNYLGVSLLTEAPQEPSAERGSELLRRAAEAERQAIAIEPENSYYYSNLGRVLTSQALLHPAEATLPEVRAAFAEALRRDPFNAEIMDHVGNAMIQLGQTVEARSIAVRAEALYPTLGQPLGLLGYLALVEKRWGDAADTLELAVHRQWSGEKEPLGAAWSNLSAAYLSLSRFADARSAAEEAIELNPEDTDARGNRDIAIEQLGKPGLPRGGATR